MLGLRVLLGICLFSLVMFAPGPDGISASIVTGTFGFVGRWHSLLKVSGWRTLSIILFMIGLLLGCFTLTHEWGEVSPRVDYVMPVAARKASFEPDIVGNEKPVQVNTSFSWIDAIASFVALLCCVAVGYMLHNGVWSHGVVTHDYLCGVKEHLKGHLDANSRRTDWSIAEIQMLCKRVGEQERMFAQLLESLGEKKTARDKQEQDAAEKASKDAAKHNASLQQLDHRLALLERILSDLVSTGVNAGVNSSTSSGSVSERPKAEPPAQAGSDSDSLSGAETHVSGIEVVTPLDQSSDGKIPNPVMKTLFKPKSEEVIWFPGMKKKKPVSHALSSELHPGCQDDPMKRAGGGLDPNRLFSDVVRGLKRRAQGVSPA